MSKLNEAREAILNRIVIGITVYNPDDILDLATAYARLAMAREMMGQDNKTNAEQESLEPV